jgi:hypothetical protein
MPAWKVAEAQTLAHFRNFAPLITLLCEYSLAERYIEAEFVHFAQEKGLGLGMHKTAKRNHLTDSLPRLSLPHPVERKNDHDGPVILVIGDIELHIPALFPVLQTIGGFDGLAIELVSSQDIGRTDGGRQNRLQVEVDLLQRVLGVTIPGGHRIPTMIGQCQVVIVLSPIP